MGKEILRSTANDLWPDVPCAASELVDSLGFKFLYALWKDATD
jgi:hypothetical protein